MVQENRDVNYAIAEPEHVAYVRANLREMDKIETELAGNVHRTPAEFIAIHRELYTAFNARGVPVALVGCTEAPDNMFITCIGTPEMMHYMVKLTRGAHGFLANRADIYSPKPLVAAVYELNHASKRWMKMLGFRYSGWDINKLELMKWYPKEKKHV